MLVGAGFRIRDSDPDLFPSSYCRKYKYCINLKIAKRRVANEQLVAHHSHTKHLWLRLTDSTTEKKESDELLQLFAFVWKLRNKRCVVVLHYLVWDRACLLRAGRRAALCCSFLLSIENGFHSI